MEEINTTTLGPSLLKDQVPAHHTIGGAEYLELYPAVAYPYLIIIGSASIVGTVGNLLVLGAVSTNKQLRNARNSFLVNLAFADLCVTGYADPLSIIGMVKGREYFENRPVLCDITSSICLTACVCALFSIGGISFNRYLNICRPNIYPHVFNLRNNIIMCVSFWCVGLVMALPGLVGWTDNVYDHKMLECIWNRLHSLSYTIFFSSGVVLTPIIIISFSYICIFLHVRASKRKIDSEATHQQKAKKNMAGPVKLAKTLFIIFLIFVSCWGPYALLVVIDFNDKLPHELHLYVLMLAHMHSTLSPIVYAITNIHFRNGYKMILFKVKCVGRNLVNSEQMQYMEKTNSDQTHFNGGQI